MNSKILTLLGFASKAGKISCGAAKATDSVKSGKAKLVVASEELSEKSLKEITFFADKKGIRVITLDGTNTQTLTNAVGRSCAVLSVDDANFASSVTTEYGRKC